MNEAYSDAENPENTENTENAENGEDSVEIENEVNVSVVRGDLDILKF